MPYETSELCSAWVPRPHTLGTAPHIGQYDRNSPPFLAACIHTDKKSYSGRDIKTNRRVRRNRHTAVWGKKKQTNCQPARKAVTQSNFSYSPMSCGRKFFLSPTLLRDPCLLLPSGVCSPFILLTHFFTVPSEPSVSKCLCVRVCVRLSTSSSSLVWQLYRRSSKDRRPWGQLQNNESLKAALTCRV